MFPANPNLLIQPLDPADFVPSDQTPASTFTQLVQDTLDGAGTSADGFDQLLSDTSAGLDALDAILGEQDVALDAVLTALNSTDPAPLDNSFAGYVQSFDAGNSFVAASSALSPPDLFVLPLVTTPSGVIPTVPAAVTQDFGTLHLGSASQSIRLATASTDNGQYFGDKNVALVNGDRSIFSVQEQQILLRSGAVTLHWNLVMTPAALGQFAGQVEWYRYSPAGIVIMTATVNVIP